MPQNPSSMSTLRSFKSLPDLLVAREPDSGGRREVGRSTRGEGLGPWGKGQRGRRNQWGCEDVQQGFLNGRDNWGSGGGGEDVEGPPYKRLTRRSRIYQAGAGFTQSTFLYLTLIIKCQHDPKHILRCAPGPFVF